MMYCVIHLLCWISKVNLLSNMHLNNIVTNFLKTLFNYQIFLIAIESKKKKLSLFLKRNSIVADNTKIFRELFSIMFFRPRVSASKHVGFYSKDKFPNFNNIIHERNICSPILSRSSATCIEQRISLSLLGA